MEEIFRKLTTIIKKNDEFIFMTHRNMDLDGFGSALCMYSIIESFGKKGHIFINKEKNNKSIEKAFVRLKEGKLNIEYIDKTNYQKLIKKNCILIILDIHKIEMLEYPKMLEKIDKIIVIDHHVKSYNYIKNTALSYISTNYSSTNEMMTNYLKYLNKTVPPLIATMMLSGIEIDTNSFNVKTTPETYEAASFLVKMGADNVIKQELLKESKAEFVRRQEFVKDSFMINETMAMCILDENIYEKKELATIAEELLQFDDIEASFSIGKVGKNLIGVSARSISKINVEEIMTKIGGGGHINQAAAELKNTTIEEVKKSILQIASQY
ncbi:MAG: DHH family phosphoesterase [Bacilli bacterium]